MRFLYEESELINNFISEEIEVPKRILLIEKINAAAAITEDPELVEIAKGTITKLRNMNDDAFNIMVSNLPVDNISIY